MIKEENIKKFSEQCKNIFSQIERDVIGQKNVVEGVVIAMIAGGNVLLEGVPGVGKTRLVRSLGRVFNLPFSRIQFTPDLMPADVTGTNIIVKDAQGNTEFSFQPGPVFSNIILADEINRATPKTQSALLEAMQEHTVTVMGVSRRLEEPFFVLATQNPVEQDGTYPLPEAQMDRFMFKLIVKNPSLDELMDIVNMTQKTMAEVAEAACNGQDLLDMRKTANAIPVAEDVMRYAMMLCSATHPDSDCATETAKKYVRLGASPRAGQALISAAKVRALLLGRFNVSYSDLHALAYPVLRHRMKLTFDAIAERIDPDEIIERIIKEVEGRRGSMLGKADKQDDEQPLAPESENGQEQSAVLENEAATEAAETETEQNGKKKKRGFFGRK